VTDVAVGWKHALFLDRLGQVHTQDTIEAWPCLIPNPAVRFSRAARVWAYPWQVFLCKVEHCEWRRAADTPWCSPRHLRVQRSVPSSIHLVRAAMASWVMATSLRAQRRRSSKPSPVPLHSHCLSLLTYECEWVEGVNVADVAAAQFHSLVVSEQGEVYGFGCDDMGQLGLGKGCGYEPYLVYRDNTPGRAGITIPQRIDALVGQHIVAVSAGDHHSLFLSREGKVFSCGMDKYAYVALGGVHKANLSHLVTGRVVRVSSVTQSRGTTTYRSCLERSKPSRGTGSSASLQVHTMRTSAPSVLCLMSIQERPTAWL
jgi:hypothetical protein